MTFRNTAIAALAALTLSASAGAVMAEQAEPHIEDIAFSFEGPFGKYDPVQLQRGLKLYTQVCSACHGLQYVPLRTLADPAGVALPEDQVRAYAANFPVNDPASNPELTDSNGDTRALKETDHFPANNSMGAPDLSLMAKKRAAFHGPYGTGINQLFKGVGGPEYIHAILTGYTGETKTQAGNTFYENTAFPGGWIKMPPPLYGDDVEFDDGTKATMDQESKDVAAFLMWTAEPKMMARKQAGLTGVIFLTVLSVLLYLTNKRLWGPIKGKRKSA